MNTTTLNQRLASAATSIALTFALFSGVVAVAQSQGQATAEMVTAAQAPASHA